MIRINAASAGTGYATIGNETTATPNRTLTLRIPHERETESERKSPRFPEPVPDAGAKRRTTEDMYLSIRYTLTDLRHFTDGEHGTLDALYDLACHKGNGFMRSAGRLRLPEGTGKFYDAARTLKLNGWLTCVNRLKEHRFGVELSSRLLYIDGKYATAVYETGFRVSLHDPCKDIGPLIRELLSQEVRISKAFVGSGNSRRVRGNAVPLPKDFSGRELLTTLGEAGDALVRHYHSATTKAGRDDTDALFYPHIRCERPCVLLVKDERETGIVCDGIPLPDEKFEAVKRHVKDREGRWYPMYALCNPEQEEAGWRLREEFAKALSLRLTLDRVMDEIGKGRLLPAPRSRESDRLQEFLVKGLKRFSADDASLRPALRETAQAAGSDFYTDFDEGILRNNAEQVIRMRPDTFRRVAAYLNRTRPYRPAPGFGRQLKDLVAAIEGLREQLQTNRQEEGEEIKELLKELREAVEARNREAADTVLDKLKRYGGPVLDVVGTAAAVVSLFV